MKLCDPMTMTGALREITDALGVELCASHVGKSVSLMYKWTDPDNEAAPSIEQAFSLERLYVSTHGCHPQRAPISSVWVRLLNMHVSDEETNPFEVLQLVLALPASVGNLSDRFSEAINDGIITLGEKKEIRQAIASARKHLDELEQSFSEESSIEIKPNSKLTS